MKLTKCKLGDLIEVTRGASLSGEFYAEEGEYVRLTLGNFDQNSNGFKINTSKTDLYFTGEVRDEFILDQGDIITPLTEQSIGLLGTTARIPKSNKYIQSQDIALVRCKKGVDPNFIYYLLPSQMVRQQLSAGAQQTKIRHTSPDKIKDCIIWVPNYEEQAKIGKLLRSIDEKIAINKAINHNLEVIAKQLYDYWFVQFDFPNEKGKPYKSNGGELIWNQSLNREIPLTWKTTRVGDILKSYPNTRKLQTKDYLAEGKYPIFDQDASNYIAGYTNEEDAILHEYPAVLFGDHSTCVKFINFPFARGADGTQILYPNNNLYSPFFFFLSILSLNIPNPGYSRHFKYLKDLNILTPEESITNKFERVVKPIYQHWTQNIINTNELLKLRERILPLLMNGQVTVNYDLFVY